jgi:hypothetical protein
MRGWVATAAGLAALGFAGAAAAQEPGKRVVVHLCERGNYAEQALKREHGQAPFATAAEVLAATRGEAPRWSTPVCMSSLEHYRLDQALRREATERRERLRAVQLLARR